MDRGKWEKILTHFQACARGYLVRNEVRRAREDFEDIVREIDGGLGNLQWRDTVIPIPHFTDTDHPFLRPSRAASKPSDPGLDVSGRPQSLTPAALSRVRDHGLLPQKIEAERDDSEIKCPAPISRDCFPSSWMQPLAGEDGECQRQRGQGQDQEEDKDGGVMESSLELDVNYSHSHRSESCVHNTTDPYTFKGPQQYCLAQEVPHTPEALRLHRNTLTMELVWLQQAIDSRKKYLSLKNRLTIS